MRTASERRKKFPRAAAALLAVVAALSAAHFFYLSSSRIIPSEDEVHYMTGAFSIADGVRSGTWSGAWKGYLNALGFKAPLVCFPAAIFVLLSDTGIQPCMLSLVPTFAVLGFLSFRLFRRCTGDWSAMAASTLLLCAPMITGLAHNFYVELLLVVVSIWYLDLLAARPWSHTGAAAALGFAAGLGILTKSSFPALVALPTIFSLLGEIRNPSLERARRFAIVAGNSILALVVAMVVAGPWYVHNLAAVLRHAQSSMAAASFYYSHWIQADLSSGPGTIVAFAAAIGCVFVARDLAARRIEGPRRDALLLVLLLALNTAIAVASTINKATRFFVTALPAFALFAIILWEYASWPRLRKLGPGLLVVWSLFLAFHISFGIPSVSKVRLGAMSILDSSFSLNGAEDYDNHPLERRNFHIDEIDDAIATDAEKRFAPGQLIRIRLASDGLLSNFYYFQVVNQLKNRTFDYAEWLGSTATGPDAPEYIVGYEGFEGLYLMENHYRGLRDDVALGRIEYVPARVFEGPEHTRVVIYARKAALGGVPKFDFASMTRSPAAPAYSLESLGTITAPLAQPQPITIRARGDLLLYGWAVDSSAKSVAGGVAVVIDSEPHTAQYGRLRRDVADYFQVPAYSNSGFSASIPAIPGRHRMAIRVVGQDRRSYSEGASIELDIR